MAERCGPSELLRLDATIRAALDLAVTDSAPQDFVVSLRQAADLARAAGYVAEVDHRLQMACDTALDASRRALELARIAKNDRAFRDHAVAGLRVVRADITDTPTLMAELDVVYVTTPGGCLLARPRAGDEREMITIAGELQLLVCHDARDVEEISAERCDLDGSHLRGELARLYSARAMRRVVWGMGSCTLTSRRAVGVIVESTVRGVRDSAERSSMPLTSADGARRSIIAFSCHRGVFERHETFGRRARGRTPYVNLIGDCGLAMRSRAIADGSGLAKPGGGVIAAAMKLFVGTHERTPRGDIER